MGKVKKGVSGHNYAQDVRIVHGVAKSIKIPSGLIGSLLKKGKGGSGRSQIKSIEEQSGAKIKVNTDNIAIQGEVDKIKLAERLIYDHIGWKVTSKTIRVAQSQVAKIIGRQGCTIKMIQDFSGASVKIAQTDKERERQNDVKVEICGTENQILKAEAIIARKTWTIDPVSQMTHSRKIIKIKQLDDKVKEKDILALYPDCTSIPEIKIKTEKSGVGKFATLAFSTMEDAQDWMHQLNNGILGQRRIILKE